MPDSSEKTNPLFLDSLERAFRVIGCFNSNEADLTNKQLQEASGLTFQTVDRVLKTLEAHGYVEKTTHRKTYSLALRALDFQYQFLGTNPFIKTMWPMLVDLRDKCNGRVSYCELDGTDVRYLARVSSNDTDYLSALVGRRYPAFATTTGRAILSQMPLSERKEFLDKSNIIPITASTETDLSVLNRVIEEAFDNGYTMNESDIIKGETNYAAPVFGREGRVCGAIGISVRYNGSKPTTESDALISHLLSVSRNASMLS